MTDPIRTNDHAAPAGAAPTFDSFQNFMAQTGRGTGNQHDGSHYGFNPVSRNRMQMELAYRGSWVCGRVIDAVAKDMTREGAIIIASDDPSKLSEFEKDIERLQIWKQLCDTIRWARLYGGAIAFMMIDGQDPATPLRLNTIKKGQFRGLLPMDRWVLNPSLSELVSEMGQNFGKPTYYDTVPDTGGMPRMKIHYSRVIRLEGVDLPYWQRIGENLWGQSVLERMWDRLIAFDSATSGVAQLVYKAHLRTLSIEGLREIIGGNQAAMKGVLANIAMIRAMQSNEGLTLLDSRDTYETHQYSFAGLDTVMMQLGEQLAGATEIPLVRLFGQSPSGFSTGDTDIRNYFDSIKQQQVAMLGDGVATIYRLAYISKFGTEPPADFAITFKPLWQLTDIEKSQISNQSTAAIGEAFSAQMISRSTAMKELKALAKTTGMFSNIDDKDIKEAESDPTPTPEALGLHLPEKAPGAAQSASDPQKPGRGVEPGAAKAPVERKPTKITNERTPAKPGRAKDHIGTWEEVYEEVMGESHLDEELFEEIAKHEVVRGFTSDDATEDGRKGFNPDELRDSGGRWTTGGKSGSVFKHNGKEWTGGTPQQHIMLKRLGVPPAATNVRLNMKPALKDLAATWFTGGKKKYKYTAGHNQEQDSKKFERFKAFDKVFAKTAMRAQADMMDESLSERDRDSAAITYMMSHSATRVGNERNTGAKKKAYGATTLQARHFRIDGNTVKLNFSGKAGHINRSTIVDANLAKYLGTKYRAPTEKVFTARDYNVRSYLKGVTGLDYIKAHDFRTWWATSIAIREVARTPVPSSKKMRQEQVMRIATIVSKKLNNAPKEALKSYIDPTVFKNWKTF